MNFKHHSERRVRRSAQSSTALHYQMEQTRAQSRLTALVLADDSGLVLAKSGDDGLCDEVGAYAPILYQSTLQGALPEALQALEFEVQTVRVQQETMYLIAVGPSSKAYAPWLYNSAVGVKRILNH